MGRKEKEFIKKEIDKIAIYRMSCRHFLAINDQKIVKIISTVLIIMLQHYNFMKYKV